MARRDSIMTKPKDTRGTLVRVLAYFKSFVGIMAAVFILCIISNVLSLLGPSLAGRAINAAAAGPGKVDLETVKYYAVRMLLCYGASSILAVLISVTMTAVSRHLMRKMRNDVFHKLTRLPVSFFDKNQAGDIISRVSYDIDVIGTCMAADVTQILTSTVTVAGAFFMMVYISVPLAAVVLFTIPVAVIYTTQMRRITQPRFVMRSKNYGIMNGFVEEMMSGQTTIQAYAYEDNVEEQFREINKNAADGYYDAQYHAVTIGPTMGSINNVSLSIIAILGSLLYMYELITLGDISSFVLYSRKFSGPINEIANIINELFSALAAAERVFNLLDEAEETPDKTGAKTLRDIDGNVRMEHVKFGYEKDRTVIRDLSFMAEAGKMVAIVGHTGAGKTTIINLLMRFYDADEGFIFIENEEIRDCTRKSVRGAYAMVLQDTWVFNGTIFDNIAYGKENASMEEVVAAAKAAHIHSFIMRLPDGYQTVVSEDGGNISKGQKQLLTIARAMLYDARILILDEATSNVDTATEREIQKAMRKLMAGRTCFVIAHRLSTIEYADWILVLDKGDVVEQGTHRSLMADKGYYYRLYNAQFE